MFRANKIYRKNVTFFIDLNSVNKVYLGLLNEKSRYLHIYGGAGSGKSFFTAQKLLIRSLQERNHRFLLVRKVARTIRNSQFSLLKSLISVSGLKKYFIVKDGELSLFNKITNSEFITAGVDDAEKLKSIFGITSMWIEEATELEQKDFLQLDLRLRGKSKNYKQIILTYNPVNAHHWLNSLQMKNSHKVKTTYRDNVYIDDEYKEVLLNLKEQDEEFYNIYALGEWGTLKNIIYGQFEIINEYPAVTDEIIYGLDFGFNNQTALVKIYIKDKIYYTEELIYKRRLTNDDLISEMKKCNIRRSNYIYCDSAEPNRIEELRRNAFNVYPADKSVKDGIDFVKRCKIFSRAENVNLNKEVLSYSYKQDKEGNLLDEPVKFNDHLMDALRYAIYSHSKRYGGVNIRFL